MDPLIKQQLPRGVDLGWEAWRPGRKHTDVAVGVLRFLPSEDVVLTCTHRVLEGIGMGSYSINYCEKYGNLASNTCIVTIFQAVNNIRACSCDKIKIALNITFSNI